MLKKDYLEVLGIIENVTRLEAKFDYDSVLDGTYGFNVNQVSIVYDLLHVLEIITTANDSLISINQDDTLLKEFKYSYNGVKYKVTRIFSYDESTFITRISIENNEFFVPESDLLQHINKKCEENMKIFSSYYGGVINEDPAG